MAKTPAPTVRKITTLEDVQASLFTGNIRVGDELWEVNCRELTRADFARIDDAVPDPAPPQFASPTGIVYYTDDPGYKKAKSAAAEERLLWRLAEMWQIPDKTHADKLEALRTASSAFINGLVGLLNKVQFVEEVRVEALSRSFRPEETSGGAHPESNGVDARVLAGAAD